MFLERKNGIVTAGTRRKTHQKQPDRRRAIWYSATAFFCASVSLSGGDGRHPFLSTRIQMVRERQNESHRKKPWFHFLPP